MNTIRDSVQDSVQDPDPHPDPYVFVRNQSFHQQAKNEEKPLFVPFWAFFMKIFIFEELCNCTFKK
jgi:hypothetical protein